MIIERKKILITGGSGTIGNAIVRRFGADNDITIYSRSEFLQAKMKAHRPYCNYVLGDVRDYNQLSSAVAGHDIVIHAAAMKRVPECEEQPEECYKTNVLGSMNVARACIANNVQNCVALSTDKACQPVTAYGASKLMMERIFTAQPSEPCKFTMVRYGNVLESRGSVIPLWKSQHDAGKPLTITDEDMTRFWITPDSAVDWIERAFNIRPGEIFVPKMKALPIIDMITYLFDYPEWIETGLRSMERVHEFLVGPDETALNMGDHFIISSSGSMGKMYTSSTAERINKYDFLGMLTEVGECSQL